MATITLDKALDAVMHLPPDEQDMLVDIVRHRRLDQKRDEWLKEARETLDAYQKGNVKPMNAEEAINVLRSDLEERE